MENRKYPKRKNIRLKNYDYSQPGFYFITICVQNKIKLLGEIKNGEMVMNAAGEMVKNRWNELENKFKNIKLHEFIGSSTFDVEK